jgi:Arc/MetJ-type ribon-helix-helix transcriptional regulator
VTITLNPEQEKALEDAIRTGEFNSVEEFVASAIAKLQHRDTQAADSQRRDAVRRMKEFGETHRLHLGEPVTRKFLHTGHRH